MGTEIPAVPLVGASSSTRVAESAVLFAVLLWGINFSAVKLGLAEIEPLAFPVLRFGISGVVLLVILRFREGSIGVRREDLPVLLFMSVIGIAVQQVCFVYALANTSATNVSLLGAFGPIFTGVLATLFGEERLTPRHWVSAAIGVCGVVLIVRGGAESTATTSLLGDGLAIVALFLASASVLPVRPLMRRYSPYRILVFQFLAGSACLLPFAAATFSAEYVSLTGWAALAYTVVFTGVVANVLYYQGVGRIGPSAAAVIGYLQVFFGVVFAWILLGETIGPVQLLGGAVVIAGVVLSRSGGVRPKRSPRQAPG